MIPTVLAKRNLDATLFCYKRAGQNPVLSLCLRKRNGTIHSGKWLLINKCLLEFFNWMALGLKKIPSGDSLILV